MSIVLEYSIATLLFASSIYILNRILKREEKRPKRKRYQKYPTYTHTIITLNRQGYSTRQISRMTGIPKSTVHKYIKNNA